MKLVAGSVQKEIGRSAVLDEYEFALRAVKSLSGATVEAIDAA
ncbi:MAG: hypothetical protein WDO68_04425 [Gammaproteobacteria bacterium]